MNPASLVIPLVISLELDIVYLIMAKSEKKLMYGLICSAAFFEAKRLS